MRRDARMLAAPLGRPVGLGEAWEVSGTWSGEVELSFEVVGTRPLLLLDDVMSELDERRSVALMDFVQGTIQSVVTTANVGNFPRELLDRATLVGISEP